MSFVNCKTPELLYQRIEQTLKYKYQVASEQQIDIPEKTYHEAQTCALGFRKIYKDLPVLPASHPRPLVGLQELMAWCIEADGKIDEMAIQLDLRVINRAIKLLKKLRKLARKLPHINKDLWNQAEQKARECPDFESNLLAMTKKQDSKLPAHKVLEKIHDEVCLEIEKKYFCKIAEELYRDVDTTYAKKLHQLDDQIGNLIEKINWQLNKPPFGDLLDAYCKLNAIPLDNVFAKIGRAYSLDAMVDLILFGPNLTGDRGVVVDKGIAELESISQRIMEKGGVRSSTHHEPDKIIGDTLNLRLIQVNWRVGLNTLKRLWARLFRTSSQ